jgi:HlyD family secretion protein
MKKTVPIAIALIAVCGVGGLAVRGMSQGKKPDDKASAKTKVTRGTLAVTVVENGTVDAIRSVEVKSRVTGRLARLLVEEGDFVRQGQLIAVIDPKETQFKVQQDAAQLRGAQSAVDKASLEIAQRRVTARAAYQQARARAAQLALELKAQPVLTNAALTEAQTSLETALQERERLIKSAHPTQKTTTSSATREAQANFENAEREYQRQSDLEEKGYVAGKSVESAKLALDLARVRLESARDNEQRLEAQLRSELAKADEQIRQTRAAVARARANRIQDRVKREEYLSALAEVERARATLSDPAVMEKGRDQNQATVSQLSSVLSDSQRQLGETEIRAPISGVVTKKGLQVGELATGLSSFSSGSTIVKIEDRTAMRVKLDMNEIDVAKITLGMPAKVDVDALPDKSFTGTVEKIAPASKDATPGAQADAVVRYEVEILLRDNSDRLRSGMSAKCNLDVIRKENVLLLPLEYVGKKEGKHFVALPTKGNDPKAKPLTRDISVGAASGSQIEVLSGVAEGDEVQKPAFDGPERKGMMSFGKDEE